MKFIKIFFVSLFSFFCSAAYSQGGITMGTVSGAIDVTDGVSYTYSFNFPTPPSPWCAAQWFVVGGQVLYNDDYTATIQWDYGVSFGLIEVWDWCQNQYANLYVAVNGVLSTPVGASPASQNINYGTIPGPISLSFSSSFPPTSNPVSYQWQVFQNNTATWVDMSGQNSISFQSSDYATETTQYRCVITLSGYTIVADASWVIVTVANFLPGTIFLTLPPNYNTNVHINTTPATGGQCTPLTYAYQWELAYENAPWTIISTGAEFPGPFLITNKFYTRRKATCNGVSLYSNTLTIDPIYTPVDYENRNYVREITVVKRGIQSYYQADQLPVGDKFQSTTYFDGLGRPIQSVDKGTSPGANNTWNDVVSHVEYDAAGRTPKGFLPYATNEFPGKFKTNAATAQPPFIRAQFNEPLTAPTHSIVEYDNSPLNRVMKTMAPGQSWAGSNVGIVMSYDFNNSNTTNEKVHIWNLDYSSTALPVTSPALTYTAGKLQKVTTTDEHNNKVITYSDFSGNVILKKVQEADPVNLTVEHSGWTCTYYVYDDFGMIRYVITPKAVQYLDANGWNLTQEIVNELCYKYLYDERGRLIVKKKPGAGEESMVYDKKDRLVLSQDANQKIKNQWSFILYDYLNRTVATGLFDNPASRQSMQNHVNGFPSGPQTISVFTGNGIYQSINVDNPVAGSTGTSNYCNGCSAASVTYNSITHYDNYNYSGVKSFNTSNTLAFSVSSDPQIEPTVKTDRITDMVTGEKIRVLDFDNNPLNDKFLYSTAYYDEAGRSLQNLADNIKNATDYQTNQYNFKEELVSSFVSHSNGTETFTVTSKQEFDKTGRLLKLYKNFNNSFYKQLSEYSYDALGQAKTKRLAPGYTATGANEIESVSYDYNIRGWLTGINKDYALSTDNYGQWNKYFGLYLGYTNTDNMFAQPRLDGNITGSVWKSQGDNSPRKYDYTYDRLDRFTSALFKQKKRPSDGWLSTEVDFSAFVEYEDKHGNIKTMKHMGVMPGINNGIIVDMLNYTYNTVAGTVGLNGNKLIKVDDIGHGLGTKNGILGDFKDGVTVSEEYFYDDNGNLVKDLNKNIVNGSQNGVIYNFLNKPEKIEIPGKSTIEFTYDASGEKLSKKVTPATGTAKTTYYISDFVYEETTLQFILHEEGRLKIITPHAKANDIDYDLNAGSAGIIWPGNKQGVFEYFLKDHLGSTRIVLTEEVQKEYYKATMETNVAAVEEALFGKVNTNGSIPTENEVKNTRLVNSCAGTPWPGNCSNLSKLTATGSPAKKLGPNLILKVMAGDIISSRTDYYYLNNNSAGPAGNPVDDVLNSLIWAITSPGKANDLSKAQNTDIRNNLLNNSQLPLFINNQNTTGINNEPKAYLNVIFLDEQFKYVEADLNSPDVGSGSLRVSHVNNPSAFLFMQKKAPKNGWVFVYVSNQSNEPVYFDNFNVTNEHSRIAEETHYYPYGLKIAGISSKAFNKLENKYGYQGDYSEEETETGWDEFFLRMYDPQLGRWIAEDPNDQYPSPFIGMGNNPINSVDPDGGWDWIYNKLTDQYEWHDDINSLEGFLKSSLNKDIYAYDEGLAKGGFIKNFAGTPHTYHRNGYLEAYGTLEPVTVSTANKPEQLLVKTQTKCHLSNEDVVIAQETWWYDVTKNLNRTNGQVMPPRSKAIDFIIGGREIDIMDYPDLFEKYKFPTNPELQSIYKKYGWNIMGVDGDGYIVGRQKMYYGTPPAVGFRGLPISSLSSRARQLSNQIGKKSITIKTTNGHIRFDLAGRPHGSIQTPHKLRYTINIGPNGKINFSKPKLPSPMTEADLRLIRNFLKKQ